MRWIYKLGFIKKENGALRLINNPQTAIDML